MYVLRAATIASVFLLTVAGCSAYDPPVQGDHTAAHYKTDLEACRTSAGHAVYLKNASGLFTWIASPVTGPPRVRQGIRSCLEGKGYKLAAS